MPRLNGVQVAAAAYIADFSGNDLVTAVQLAWAVSEWNSDRAVNDHYGLWQIKKSAHPDLFRKYKWNNPADNARMANILFQKDGGLLHPSGGFGAWHGAFNKAKYDAARPGAERDVAELKRRIGTGEKAEKILGYSRTDGSKSPEASLGGKVIDAAKSMNPLGGLFQGHIWLRVAEVGLGVILIAVGIAKLTNAVPIATKIAKKL